MSAKVLTALVVFLLAAATPAVADEWSFDFESPGNYSVVGVLTTSDTPNVLGNLDVTGITGTVNGDPITSLLANPNQPFVFTAPDLNFWDNNLIPNAPFVTVNGIGFDFEGDELVLFSGITSDPFSEGIFDENLGGSFQGTLSVPEPATSGLFLASLLGLGVIWLALRRKPRQVLSV